MNLLEDYLQERREPYTILWTPSGAGVLDVFEEGESVPFTDGVSTVRFVQRPSELYAAISVQKGTKINEVRIKKVGQQPEEILMDRLSNEKSMELGLPSYEGVIWFSHQDIPNEYKQGAALTLDFLVD